MQTALATGSLLILTMGAIAGCATRSVEIGQLEPAAESPLVRGEDYIAAALPDFEGQADRFAHTLTVGNDSIRVFVELVEYDPVVEARVAFFNYSTSVFDIGLKDFTLVDENGAPFDPVDCHDLANDMIKRCRGAQKYLEKPPYRHSRRLAVGGGRGPEDPRSLYSEEDSDPALRAGPPVPIAHGLGQAVGRTISEEEAVEIADRIYRAGIGEMVGIVPGSRFDFSVFWKNREEKSYPLRVLLRQTDIEFAFGPETK